MSSHVMSHLSATPLRPPDLGVHLRRQVGQFSWLSLIKLGDFLLTFIQHSLQFDIQFIVMDAMIEYHIVNFKE